MEKSELIYLPIDCLTPHPDNPRKELGDLSELTESIKIKGIMQNLTVVPYKSRLKPNLKFNGQYTIIIGHRRYAAAKLAGLDKLPCIITDMSLQEQISTMLLENMQRSDLTVYEQAQGFQMMLDLGDTVESVSEKSGFSESTIRRRIKLLELDEDKFKKAESRGATLFEYAELDKIKNIELKNKVLEYIGTENFKNELKRAISDEKNSEYLESIEKEISKFALEITDTTGYEFKKGYYVWSKDSFVVPDDTNDTQYYYHRSHSSICIYVESKHKTEAPGEDQEIIRKREDNKAEKLSQLAEATKRAYELRKEFVESLPVTTVKRFLPEIYALLMYLVGYSGNFIDDEAVLDILGINLENVEDDDELVYTYDDVLNSVNKEPEIKLLRMVCLYVQDHEKNGYYESWRKGFHVGNTDLTAFYDFLMRLGYEMSDEEKALRDGTHELFLEDDENV